MTGVPQQHLNFYDPSKEYLQMRQEWIDLLERKHTIGFTIIETAQTTEGQWYAKRLGCLGLLYVVHLDTRYGVPQDLLIP